MPNCRPISNSVSPGCTTYSSPGGGPASAASGSSEVVAIRSASVPGSTGTRNSSPARSTLGSAMPLSRCRTDSSTPKRSAISPRLSPGCTV